MFVNFVHFLNTNYTKYHAPCQLCGNDQRLRSGSLVHAYIYTYCCRLLYLHVHNSLFFQFRWFEITMRTSKRVLISKSLYKFNCVKYVVETLAMLLVYVDIHSKRPEIGGWVGWMSPWSTHAGLCYRVGIIMHFTDDIHLSLFRLTFIASKQSTRRLYLKKFAVLIKSSAQSGLLFAPVNDFWRIKSRRS